MTLDVAAQSSLTTRHDPAAVNGLRGFYRERFAGKGDDLRFFRAAGRINLLGEHTDYSEGLVLPGAIQLNIQGAFRLAALQRVELVSKQFDERVSFSLHAIPELPMGHWGRYIAAIFKTSLAYTRSRGAPVKGLEGVLDSTIPVGSGLSSSAALELVVLTALTQLSGVSIELNDLARLGQQAEWAYGVKSGLLDQLAICHGRRGEVSFIDTRTLETRPLKVDLRGHQFVIAFTQERALGAQFNRRTEESHEAAKAFGLITDTAVKTLRDVTPKMFEAHRAQLRLERYNPKHWPLEQRAEHVVYENQRVLEAVAALERGEIARFGGLMVQTHQSLRDLYEVSSPELDAMVEAAMEFGREADIGVWGRMMGGGFGGPALLLMPSSVTAVAIDEIQRRYRAKTHRVGRFWPVTLEDGLTELVP